VAPGLIDLRQRSLEPLLKANHLGRAFCRVVSVVSQRVLCLSAMAKVVPGLLRCRLVPEFARGLCL
jgi:hypothetical protein